MKEYVWKNTDSGEASRRAEEEGQGVDEDVQQRRTVKKEFGCGVLSSVVMVMIA